MVLSETMITEVELRAQEGELVHSGFFVLRTPLLPCEELTAWSENLAAARVWRSATDVGAVEDIWRQMCKPPCPTTGRDLAS